MRETLHIPASFSEARAKLREDLADWWRFVSSAPCLSICWVTCRFQTVTARVGAFAASHLVLAAVVKWVLGAIAWVFSTLAGGYLFKYAEPLLNALLGI